MRKTTALIVVIGVLVAGVVAALVVVGFSSINDDDDAAPDGTAAAVQVARDEALAFFSLDHRNVEAGVAKVLSLATGTFAQEYAANKQQVIDQVKQKKLVAVATIPDNAVAVEFATPTQARVLVVVDVSRTIGTKVDRLRNRARILLELVDGTWRVSGVNQVG
ncbi:MAG: hypothetical protein NTV23_16865 [Propionibacteriales bacterium]|nr:hypothetical protein [Propionibacteriales bacterium]